MKLKILNFSFFSKSALGKIFYLMVLGLYAHDLCKNAKNRIVMSFLSETLCETVVEMNEINETNETSEMNEINVSEMNS